MQASTVYLILKEKLNMTVCNVCKGGGKKDGKGGKIK